MKPGPSNLQTDVIDLPAPTVFPMVLALGISLILAGMVTNIGIGLLGLLLALSGSVGWFFQVLPREHHVEVLVATEQVTIVTSRTLTERLPSSEMHRAILPIETFHISTGIKGGIAGGIAMVVPATLFSLLKYHSIWYAMNLLAAGGFVQWAGASNEFLSQFHLQGMLAALVIHSTVSLLVGLLYGAMLPMFPRYPIVTAGLMVPLLFTGILYSALSIISPILNERIEWFWFVVSQIAFGLVCGFVVDRQARVRTPQFQALPFSVRAGLHSDKGNHPATHEDKPDKKDAPGKPRYTTETQRPDQVLDFTTLYQQNCSACHGANGRNGAAISLSNAVYLATVGEATLQHITANGVSKTLMPAFARSNGGMLTDPQVAVLAHGMVEAWGHPAELNGETPPAYASHLVGNSVKGNAAFTTFCARCHGADGAGVSSKPATQSDTGSIVDPAYLALVSDQSLRSTILAGKPEDRMPDWRSDALAGEPRAMTDQEITDTVAWLASHRIATPGQPYLQHE